MKVTVSDSDSSTLRKTFWPAALALTVMWCSSHTLWRWDGAGRHTERLVHFVIFGLMATLLSRLPAVQRLRPLGLYSIVLVVSVFGVADSFRRGLHGGTHTDFFLGLSDALGAATGTVLYANFNWYRGLLETPTRTLIVKRQIEMPATPCVIPVNGFSQGQPTPRRAALAGRAA